MRLNMLIKLAMAACCLLPAGARGEDPLCQIATTSFAEAVKLRGLSKRKEVPCLVQNREQVEQFLVSTMDTKYPSRRLEHEEIELKAVGFLPAEFNYRRGLIEFYASQVGGYYDPEVKHFVMAGWMPGALQTTVAIHELTHALQDQHFDLEAFTDVRKYSTDELLARSALVEGDATAVMNDFTRSLVGGGSIAAEQSIDGILVQNAMGFSLMSATAPVPKSLQMMLFFPYQSGLRFVHSLLREGGYHRVDAAYAKPPQSSEEILHPEKYGKGDFERLGADVVLENSGEDPAAVEYADTLGEFGIATLLTQLGEAPAAAAREAAGWAGDTLVIVGRAEGSPAVYWVSQWDSVSDMREFVQAYGPRLRAIKKPGKYSLAADAQTKRVRFVSYE